MAAVTRKSIIRQLPPQGFRSAFDDRKNGIVPAPTMRDIADSFVSRVDDSPAYLTSPQTWTAPQAFASITVHSMITAASAGFGRVECAEFRYAGATVPMTDANGSQLTAEWGGTNIEVVDNMRRRINELEAKLASLGI